MATGAEGAHTVVAGNIGEVDYDMRAGRLSLLGVRPAQGWEYRVDEQEADEIEIDFRFEDGTVVEVEIELDR